MWWCVFLVSMVRVCLTVIFLNSYRREIVRWYVFYIPGGIFHLSDTYGRSSNCIILLC